MSGPEIAVAAAGAVLLAFLSGKGVSEVLRFLERF